MKARAALRRAALCAFAVLFVTLWTLFLLPCTASFSAGEVKVVWEDGTKYESYASAYSALVGAGEAGVLLERAGTCGVISPSAAYRKLYRTLEEGSFAALLSADAAGLSAIERAAVWRSYSVPRWYADGWFAWTGEKVAERPLASSDVCGRVTLFSGMPSAEQLSLLGVHTLVLRGEDVPAAADLAGTQVGTLEVSAPYAFSEGVLTYSTAGGVRVVCAVPGNRELSLPDADFMDEGALCACTQLTSLTLPYVGSAKAGAGTAYSGDFGWLFSDGERYRIPETLARIEVTGGSLQAFAFYGCGNVAHISACGVRAEDISVQAFAGCTGLQTLHSPRADVQLSGDFTQKSLPCGCTLFTRAGE